LDITFIDLPRNNSCDRSLVSADRCAQLDLEICRWGPDLLLYLGMAPKTNLGTDTAYLDRYYNQPPPPAASATGTAPAVPAAAAPAAAPQTSTVHSSSAAGSSNGTDGSEAPPLAAAAGAQGGGAGGGAAATCSGGPPPPLPSFKQLEAEARSQPGFTPFVSPSLWVRAMSATAITVTVPWEDYLTDPRVAQLLTRYTLGLTDVWLGHLAADAAAGGPAAAGGDPWVAEQWRRAGEAHRNYMWNDPGTVMLLKTFGEEQVGGVGPAEMWHNNGLGS
jgi:hypothetical protein